MCVHLQYSFVHVFYGWKIKKKMFLHVLSSTIQPTQRNFFEKKLQETISINFNQ